MNNELIDLLDHLIPTLDECPTKNLLEMCKAALTQQQEAEPVAVLVTREAPFTRKPITTLDFINGQPRGMRNGDFVYLHPPKPAAQPEISEAFAEQVREARRIWMEENWVSDQGADCLTPFDHFLYYPVREKAAEPQVPVEVIERLRNLLILAKCSNCDGPIVWLDATGCASKCDWCHARDAALNASKGE